VSYLRSRAPLIMPLAALTLLLTACPKSGGPGAFPWPAEALRKRVGPGLHGAEVKQLARDPNPASSRAMIRLVRRPTRANLDYAAYAQNPVLHQAEAPGGATIAPGAASVELERMFNKVVLTETIATSPAGTPLDTAAITRPLAFEPLVDYLARWNAGKAVGLEEARSAVKAETWGLQKRPGTYFQQIAALFVHRPKGGAPQLWVEIEFMPWAKLFSQMPDVDGDGSPEIFGQLRPGLCDPATIKRIVEDYQGRALSTKEVHAWANELASYWYPSHNTDVAPLGQSRSWPLPATEADVLASLGGQRIEDPTVVIKGKPHGKAIYNVFVIPGIAPLAAKVKAGGATDADAGLKAAPVKAELAAQRKQLAAELKRHGSWARWAKELTPLHGRIKRQLKRRPAELKALVGSGGFLFYRKSLEYVVGGEIQAQKPGKNPFSTIVGFKDYLAGLGVDFLLVPVPTKSEVFPDRLRGEKLQPKRLPLLNPHGRKFFSELTAAGVEIVDLLPAYLAARAKRKPGDEPLYQPQDTHWTDRGLRLASGLIAARVKQYAWYSRLKQRPVAYALKRVTFKRHGDLHSRLTEKEQRKYKPALLVGHKVLDPATNKPYDDDPASPVVILGDSFTGVYQRTYCENAGISAHLAHQLQHPVDLVMSYGGGPNVRTKLLSRGEADLRRKRLLIWIFAGRDLYNYWEDWEPLKVKQKTKEGR
jgi:SGNH hydrolase-like domain, acetyltransferase AlgX